MNAADTIQPLGSKVLVERDSPRDHVGAIALPDCAVEYQREATVLATGPGRMLDDGSRSPLQVKPGDRVLIGYVVQENEDRRLICDEGDILAVVED